MNDHLFQILIPVTGLVSGLIATYVSLQNRALLAEVRKELAELENRIIRADQRNLCPRGGMPTPGTVGPRTDSPPSRRI